MATLAELVVRLTADTSGFESKMNAARDTMGNVGRKMQGIGAGLTAGVTLPIAGAGLAALNFASDTQESMNAAQVVFGDASDEIVAFSETSSTAIGLAQSDFLQMGAETGAMLQNLGMNEAEAAAETINLAERAADMASIFNTDVDQAMQAIQSGLRGEADPLERFGVSLKQTAVNAHALEMGLADTTGELTEQQKTTARLSLFMQQTERLAGDFQNTSGDLANAMRILKAQAKDVFATFGNSLIPVVEKLIPLFEKAVGWFESLNTENRTMIIIVAALAAALGPVILIVGTLLTVISTIGPVVAAVIGIVALLGAAWASNFLGIRDFTMNIWNNVLLPVFTILKQWLAVILPVALGILQAWWAGVQNSLRIVGGFLSNVLIPIFVALVKLGIAIIGVALKVVIAIINTLFMPGLRAIWSLIQSHVIPILKKLGERIQEKLGPAMEWLNSKVVEPLKTGFGGIVDVARKVVRWIGRITDKINSLDISQLLPFLGQSPSPLEEGFRGIADAMQDFNREMPNLGGLSLATGAGAAGGTQEIHFHNTDVRDERDVARNLRLIEMTRGGG